MALISQETILEVKRAVDIYEVVSGYIPLKRAGSSYKALCPFHEEKTPSFHVNPERQFFKCFGCGKGGDAIGFVMEHEKVDYPEAIVILAGKAGIAVRYDERGGDEGPRREDLYKVHEWAAGIFRGLLKTAPEAEVAREFLKRRGVSEETAELFGLGYAMDAWDHLLLRARRSGFNDRLLLAAGLAVERESKSGCYDRFRGRVVFPIAGAQGRTIAFGARTLKDEEPKFINSPETAIFSKGRGFYGLNRARETLEETRTAYIVEGYLDVIVPHQAGVRGLVATLGTALTREHLKILRRYADKVVLVFDADAAGRKASERGLDLLLSENVDIFVAELTPGMDPDDVVLKEGSDRLRACLEKPREIFDFLMASLASRHGTETPAAKGRIVEEMLERIGQIPDPVKQELLVQQLAARFGIEERTLRGRLARAAEGRPEEPPAKAAGPVPAHEQAARELLAWVLADPEQAARVRAEVPADRYPTDGLRRIAEAAYGLGDRAGPAGVRELDLKDPGLMQTAVDILSIALDRAAAEASVAGCLDRMGGEEYRAEIRDRKTRYKNASEEEERKLLRQVQESKGRRPKDHRLFPGR